MLIHCGSQTQSSFLVKPLWVIAALHKVFQCYSLTSHCFRVGETHAQLRSECGSYIVRARSLTKLATSAPDQECDYLANPVANFIDNIIWVCGFISDGKTHYQSEGIMNSNSIIKSTCTLVVPAGVEPATRGFSVPRSTDWATEPYKRQVLLRPCQGAHHLPAMW